MPLISRPGTSDPDKPLLRFPFGDKDRYWAIDGLNDAEAFFRTAHLLLSPDTFVFLEGGAHPEEFRKWLDINAAATSVSLQLSTLWPRPYTVHIPATSSNLLQLAEFSAHMASPEICDHLHGYLPSEPLLAWYDAFFDPLLLASRYTEQQAREFAETLGGTLEVHEAHT